MRDRDYCTNNSMWTVKIEIYIYIYIYNKVKKVTFCLDDQNKKVKK
jgi:hypothetical protein